MPNKTNAYVADYNGYYSNQGGLQSITSATGDGENPSGETNETGSVDTAPSETQASAVETTAPAATVAPETE